MKVASPHERCSQRGARRPPPARRPGCQPGRVPGVVLLPDEGAVPDEEAVPGDDVNSELELARERDEYLEALQRLQAEFDNYRKRVDRHQREVTENAAAGLVKQLLPLLDTADLALAHGGGEDMKQLAGALFDVLAKEGLERIVPEGQAFDPELHDGVAHEAAEGEDVPPHPEVTQVFRAGYRWERPGAAPCDGQS